MHDAFVVRILEGLADLGDNLQRLGRREFARVLHLAQIRPVHILHEEVMEAGDGLRTLAGHPGHSQADARAAHLAKVIDPDNVRVAQLGQRPGFTREAFGEARIAPRPGRENLQGHQAVKPGLAGFIDRAHASSADRAPGLRVGERAW